MSYATEGADQYACARTGASAALGLTEQGGGEKGDEPDRRQKDHDGASRGEVGRAKTSRLVLGVVVGALFTGLIGHGSAPGRNKRFSRVPVPS